MFVVEKINNGTPTGMYFKRGRINSMWDATLVDSIEKATLFRSNSGILNCLGMYVRLEKPKRINRWRTQHSKRVLDTTKWKIHEVKVCQ